MCAYSEVMGKDGEVEAAEVQILSEWNLLRRICLASAMRTDSAVIGMVLILAKGGWVIGEAAVGIGFVGVQRRLRVDVFRPSWGEESERPSSRRVKTSSQRSMAASQDL
jgi:hypothetical protein